MISPLPSCRNASSPINHFSVRAASDPCPAPPCEAPSSRTFNSLSPTSRATTETFDPLKPQLVTSSPSRICTLPHPRAPPPLYKPLCFFTDHLRPAVVRGGNRYRIPDANFPTGRIRVIWGADVENRRGGVWLGWAGIGGPLVRFGSGRVGSRWAFAGWDRGGG